MRSLFSTSLLLLALLLPLPARAELNVPILLYHRFGPRVVDSMTLTTQVFESHLIYLKENGFTVIPLQRLIAYRQGTDRTPLPAKPVVIVEDDAHKSVYSDMLPLVKKYNVPVTLFVYPSAVSRASYIMTWEELRELKATGLFAIASHTYWHPNFRKDKQKLAPAEYDKFVDTQLVKSKKRLEQELGGTVDLLAWPFGIYDDDLLAQAVQAGYVATFTIEPHPVGVKDELRKLPRFLLNDNDRGSRFAAIVGKASGN
jgi:peptidoglycan/xylan/chitin deacetylase (PgdA/CDA1 family)